MVNQYRAKHICGENRQTANASKHPRLPRCLLDSGPCIDRRVIKNIRNRRRGKSGLRRRQCRRRSHRGRHLWRELSPQLPVIFRLLLRIQETDFRRRKFVENLLRQGHVLPEMIVSHMSHPLLGCVRNHIRISLEEFNRQQPVVIWRLIFGRNAQPFVIGVEVFGHGTISSYGFMPLNLRREMKAVNLPGNRPQSQKELGTKSLGLGSIPSPCRETVGGGCSVLSSLPLSPPTETDQGWWQRTLSAHGLPSIGGKRWPSNWKGRRLLDCLERCRIMDNRSCLPRGLPVSNDKRTRPLVFFRTFPPCHGSIFAIFAGRQ